MTLRTNGATMPKTIFIDSTPDIGRLWNEVMTPSDIEVAINMGPVGEADVPRVIAGYDTVINDATYFNADTLDACKAQGLRHIVFLGTGAASFVDLSAAERAGIKVSTIKGYGDTTVAEHAMGLVFAAARHISTMHAIMRAGGWKTMQGMQLKGKTLGLIGVGGIGREMARIGQGIGLKVIAWNRSRLANPPVPVLPLSEVLVQSDIVSLHLTLNDETRGFLSAARLAQMKPDAILVNTARAGVVDEAAVIERLAAGQLGHYATDVFMKEPPPPDEPLLRAPNVTVTSHAGYNTPEAAKTMYRRAIDLAAAG